MNDHEPNIEQVESMITALLLSRIRGLRPIGQIKCDGGDGSAGYTGSITTGMFLRRSQDVTVLLGQPRSSPDFFELLMRLRNASRAQPLGPWYHCKIDIGPDRKISFQYFWEKTPFRSLNEIARDIHGHLPNFVYVQRFDRAAVAEMSDFELNNCLLFYVPARVASKKAISDPLLDVFATLEWQSDVNNGGLNQYIARDHEPMTGLPRAGLYARTHRGLLRMNLEKLAALFAESTALYAHFYPRVEQARIEMQIAEVPRQEQSDILDRYFELQKSIDSARAAYIREHIADLEQAD